MRERILDAAEGRARRGGYQGFSFRELADDVGIKSASVHYHFPTKEHLAESLTHRYVERMAEYLGDPTARGPKAAVRHLANTFIQAHETDGQMCLCGVFAAESGALPERVRPEVSAYFALLAGWLEKALRPARRAPRPLEIIAALEGGLLLARASGDGGVLRGIVTATLKRVEE